MNYRILLLKILIILLGFKVQAQTVLLDEILELPGDSSKVNKLNSITLSFADLDSIILVGKLASNLADSLDYTPGIALAEKNIGIGYYFKADYLNAFGAWEKSLRNYTILGDQKGISNIKSNIGAVFEKQGNSEKALGYFLDALSVAKEIGDHAREGTVLINIANIYDNNKNTYDKAILFYNEALDNGLSYESDEIVGLALVGLGATYFDKTEYDSAIYYLNIAIESYEDPLNQSFGYNYLGKSYSELSDFDKAISYHEEAIRLARENDAAAELSQGLLGLAITSRKAKNYERAIVVLHDALELATSTNAKEELRDIYKELAESYEMVGDFSNAYLYQVLFSNVKDSIYLQSNQNRIDLMQFSFDLDQANMEIDNLEKDAQIQEQEAKTQRIISLSVIGIIVIVLIGLYTRFQYVRRTNKIIADEKQRSDDLLLNILPAETAEELKEHGEAKARKFESVSILFTDFKGFTAVAANLEPEELVKEIHERYKMFDLIMERHGVEKIKTIGDAYMAAGGLPVANDTHPVDVVKAAIDIREYMEKVKADHIKRGVPYFEVRIGIHTGPVVSGIVGTKKFAYDIWGDTVNIASRMESNSEPGKINISENTYELVKDQFQCEFRGEIEAKNRGMLKMYFLNNPVSSEKSLPEKVEVS